MNLHNTLASLELNTIQTIAGKGVCQGKPAKETDAGWPLGICRSNSTGELIVIDYHFHMIWRIDAAGVAYRMAGTGVPGYSGDGGPALEAQLNCPHDLTQDKEGNLYFSDLSNQVYRRIDAHTGIITTIAGSGKIGRGGDGSLAIDAEMDTHCGIAIAENGDIYISSEWTNNIRRIDGKTGIIDLFAGHDARHIPSEVSSSRPAKGEWLSLGGYSGDGGPKEKAGFYHPEHLSFDSNGDLYVCDNSNDRIRKIDMTTGIVTTVLGNGQRASNGDNYPAVDASTLMPDALCFDVHDNMYVGEKYGFRVRKVAATTGIVTTIAGTGVPGMGKEDVLGTETEVNSVEVGIWADPDGTVFYGDCGGRVRRIDGKTGIVSTVLGGTSVHDDEPATEGFLCGPWGISVGPNNEIYFADQWNQRIRSIDTNGVIHTIAGNGTRAYGGDGGPATDAYLGNPSDVSVDSRGRVVIADMRHGHVRRVDEDGVIRNVAGAAFQWDKGDGGPALNSNLINPLCVAHDSEDNIYVGDSGAGRIRKINNSSGIIDTVAGNGTIGYTGDGGPARLAKIGQPAAITISPDGTIYFADKIYHVIRKIDRTGTIYTIAGTGEQGLSADGTLATSATLNSPHGVEVSENGNVYFSDSGNNLVRHITDQDTLETLAGADRAGYFGDGGLATQAGLSHPTGLAIYDNTLLIADHFNHRIRAIPIP